MTRKIVCKKCGIVVSRDKLHKHLSRGRCKEQHKHERMI